MKAILLAGGGGTRLWPLSREDFPKQFLNFGGEFSLLQRSVQRLTKASFIEEIIVATNTHHFNLVQDQLEKIDATGRLKIIVEPCRKNTAPAIGYALRYLEEYCGAVGSDPIIVLPSDHLIEPESLFLNAVEQMGQLAQTGQIITFGIRPTKPETGYGYIQIGSQFNGLTFQVARFVEKPDRLTAQKYLEDCQFYWNAGIFIFSLHTFWMQLEKHAPQIHKLLRGSYGEISAHFDQMPDISIDYALMEKSSEVLVCPLAVSWSDVGSWDSVYDAMEKDGDQNVRIGQVFAIDTINSLIIGSSRLVSTIGLEDMLIVETEDALFISKKGESQRVKGLVQELVQKGRKESFLHKIQVHAWGITHLLYESDGYALQRIEIFGQKQCELKKKKGVQSDWIILKGAPDPQEEEGLLIFYNSELESIELLLIEKKIEAGVMR